MTSDLYQELRTAVLKGFEDGLTVVEGSRPRDDVAVEARWRETVDRLTREYPDLIISGATWHDHSDPGQPLLRWHWVKRQVFPDQGKRVLLAEGQAWVIDGYGKLIEKLAMDAALPEKLTAYGLTVPAMPEKKVP